MIGIRKNYIIIIIYCSPDNFITCDKTGPRIIFEKLRHKLNTKTEGNKSECAPTLPRYVVIFYSHSLHFPSTDQNTLHTLSHTMQHFHPQPHIAAAGSAAYGGPSAAASSDIKRGKKRGSYNCGRCGLPKKGHNCNVKTPTSPSHSSLSNFSAVSAAPSAASAARQPPPHLRRALSFDDSAPGGGFDDDPPELTGGEAGGTFPEPDVDLDLDSDSGGLPVGLLWEVLRRLPPAGLLSAARVCRGWRETTRRLWRAAEELKVRVPARVQVGFVASMLQKCPGIVRLSLRMERCGICSFMLLIRFN